MAADSAGKSPWWIVAGSVASLAVSFGAISSCMGLFIKPLEGEFGWDRATVSGAKGLSSLVAMVALIIFGWMIDRWGIRRVLIPAVAAFGLCVGMMSMIQSVVTLIAFQLLIGLTGAGHSPLGFVKSISSFFDGRRGLAIGIALAGTGLGNAVMPQYAQWVIGEFGWRAGFIALGAAIWLVALPCIVLLIRDPLPTVAQRDASVEHQRELPGHSLSEALRTRAFWTITVVLVLASSSVNGFLIHIVPIYTDRGVDPAIASSAFMAFGLATILGRMLVGWLFDRWFAPLIIAPALLIAALGLGLIITNRLGFAGVAMLGIAAAAELTMIGYLTSRCFGLRKQAQLSGFFYAAFALGLATGEYGYGLLYDAFGSYQAPLLIACALLTIAAVLILTLGPYTYVSGGGSAPDRRIVWPTVKPAT